MPNFNLEGLIYIPYWVLFKVFIKCNRQLIILFKVSRYYNEIEVEWEMRDFAREKKKKKLCGGSNFERKLLQR